MNGARAGRHAGNRDFVGIASEGGDVPSYPPQRCHLVFHAIISRQYTVVTCAESEYAKSVVHRYVHEIVIVQQVFRAERNTLAGHKRPAVYVNNHVH